MVRSHTFFCLPHCFFLLGSPGFSQIIKKNCQIEKKIFFVFISQRTVAQQEGLSCGFLLSNQTTAASTLEMTDLSSLLKVRPVGSINMLTEKVYFHQGLAVIQQTQKVVKELQKIATIL